MREYIRKLERENEQMKDILARIGMALLEDMLNERECHCDDVCDCDCHDECDGCCCEGECDCDTCEFCCGEDDEDCEGNINVICPVCGNPFVFDINKLDLVDTLCCPYCNAEVDLNNIEIAKNPAEQIIDMVKEKLNKEEIQATAEKLVEQGKDVINTVLHSETANDLKRRGRNIAIKLAERIDEDLKKSQDDKK